MPGPFHTKVALVTGAASGIGRATALRFAKEGASVVVADVEAVGAQETVRLIKAATGEAIFIGCDVSQVQEVKAMIAQAIATYGRLDYDLNSAGIEGELSTTADYPEEVWNKVIGINLTDPYLCMKYALPQMLKQGGGAIVNMASILGVVGFATAGTIHIAIDGPDGVLTCMCPKANPEANRQENKHIAVGEALRLLKRCLEQDECWQERKAAWC